MNYILLTYSIRPFVGYNKFWFNVLSKEPFLVRAYTLIDHTHNFWYEHIFLFFGVKILLWKNFSGDSQLEIHNDEICSKWQNLQ